MTEPQIKKQKLEEDQVEQLKKLTTIVADTGDIDTIRKFKPQDATTNPSLIYKAATMPAYAKLLDDAVAYGNGDITLTMVRAPICLTISRHFSVFQINCYFWNN
jgi:transaldolase